MFPTREQIERAAYDRWLCRHRAHGRDRDDWVGAENELTFALNYRTIFEHPLEALTPSIIGETPRRRCRFCERSSQFTSFSQPWPVVQGPLETSLFSAEVCDQCQVDGRDPLALASQSFWKSLSEGAELRQVFAHNVDSMAVFKALVASALLVMAEDDLADFTDTLEWVTNPDHDFDFGQFAGTEFRFYQAPFLAHQSWISLARRIDHDAPFPFMIFFMAWGGVVVQISLPLCARDHDLDGRRAISPRRSLVAGEGPNFQEASSTVLRLRGRSSSLALGAV